MMNALIHFRLTVTAAATATVAVLVFHQLKKHQKSCRLYVSFWADLRIFTGSKYVKKKVIEATG